MRVPTIPMAAAVEPEAPPPTSPVRSSLSAMIFAALNVGLKIGSHALLIPLSLIYLGREEYGFWIILQAISGYLLLSDFGLGQTILNFQGHAYSRGNQERVNRILATSFGLYWFIVLFVWIGCGVILLTQPVDAWLLGDISGWLQPVVVPYLFLCATLVLARLPLTVFPATMLGLRELVLRQVLEASLALYLLFGTALTLILGGRVLALIWVTNLGLVALGALSYWLLRFRHPHVRLHWQYWSPSLLWPLLANSSFFFLYALGLLFQRLTGSILAGRFAGLEDVPQMYVLLTLFRIAGWSLAEIPSRTIQPYVIKLSVEGRNDRVTFLVSLATKMTFALATLYSALIWVLADVGLRLWLGPGLFLGYMPLAYLAGSFLIDALFLSSCNFMRALNRHRGLSVVMATYAIVSFVLGVAGAMWWSPDEPLTGLCAGFFAASVLAQALILPWITNDWLRMPWRRYGNHFLLRPALLVVAPVVLMVLFGSPDQLSFATRGTSVVFLLVIVPLFAWFVVLTQSEREWLLYLGAKLKAR